ncbi:MAG: hypothetical protein FLDDKLPJ_00517 [Phycisphaerae bacterium]|nr:hypothetical protein [Phycisphaerae bacterium]
MYWKRGRTLGGFLLLSALTSGASEAQEPGASAPPDKATSEKPATESAPTPEPAEAEKAVAPKPKPKKPTSKAWGARRETDPPAYVDPTTKGFIEPFADLEWLDFGLEHRTRFEHRDDDYRKATLQDDDPFLMRSRVYIGVKEIFDPLRFTLELQDSRIFDTEYPEVNQDVDEHDVQQAYAELFFKDALGPGYPVRLQAGRMSFDLVNRRLVARNRWRNTTNAYDGFRLMLGDAQSDWQLDMIAVMPVERRLRQLDPNDEERWLYGIVGAWRGWSDVITLEPYYFYLNDQRKDPGLADREIHTVGLHGFGVFGKSGFDYDFDGAIQLGDDGPRDHRAFFGAGELGYTFKHDWKPRLSASVAYASGDRNPDDSTTERFDRMFGAGHFWSSTDYFVLSNTIMPRLRVEFRPIEPLRVDASYGAFWLASDSDTWGATPRRDRTGRSGDFVGQDIDLRVRYQLHANAELETGYTHFIPGSFVGNTGDADDSDFFYVAMTVGF